MPVITLPTTPHLIAGDTWLVPTLSPVPEGGFIGVHTMVIRGAEPIVVDTGASLVRDEWFEKVFSLVDPSDVKWVFVSHDDHDHVGNLLELLDLCPGATLVANFSMTARLAGDLELPLHRMRWVDPGQSFDAGDRTLAVVRPPLFDSPATRGLFDTSTGVLWAVDSFGALVQGDVHEAADVADDLYGQSFVALNVWNTPWLEWLDTARFDAHVRTTASLPIEAVASAHGPILRGERIADAFARTAALAGTPPIPTPGQADLDAMVAMALSPAGEVAA